MTFMKSYVNRLKDWANLIKICTLSKIGKWHANLESAPNHKGDSNSH